MRRVRAVTSTRTANQPSTSALVARTSPDKDHASRSGTGTRTRAAFIGANGAIEIDAIESFVTLTQVGDEDSDVYEYDNSAFWPLTDKGFGNDGNDKNFHFTTELRYFFQYKGGETLTFRGDDDVWVFVNGRHAVDIGGVHGAEWGRVVLGDDGDPAIPADGDAGADAGPGVPAATDSDCSVHRGGGLGGCALEEAEKLSNDDVRFGLEKGKVYEITLFQAERHTTESNFRLTLAGFLRAAHLLQAELRRR